MPTLIALLIGAAAGLLGALCGVGGGIVMVPVFGMALGLTQQQAVATSLATIIAISGSATVQNARAGLVDWKVFAATAAGGIIAAYFGSDLMKSLSNQTLTRIFAVTLIAFGVHMLFRKA